MSAYSSFPQVPGYQISSIIGQGGMSTVYEASRDSKAFAIKIYKSFPNEAKEDSLHHIRCEGASLARINHRGLARVIEVGEFQGQPYLVLEKVSGESLASKLQKGPMTSEAVKKLAKALAETLCEVHRSGIVHRDLKPSNILLDQTGSPRLIDFGLAVRQGEEVQDRSGQVAGTFLYSSPEQIGLISRFVDARSDLYSLGCVLYQAATGDLPYRGSSLNELLQALSSQSVPDPRAQNPLVSPSLAKIIQKLLAKDPDDRYSTALHLLTDLENVDIFDIAFSKTGTIPLGSAVSWTATNSLEMPLVGRQSELSELKSHWNEAVQGQGRLVIIEAQAGDGKSRLIRELFREVSSDPSLSSEVVILTGKCSEESITPFGVFRETLDRFLKGISNLPEKQRTEKHQKVRKAIGEFASLLKGFCSELARLFPEIGPSLSVHSPEIYYEALAQSIFRLSNELGPVLMFIDDIQWLDPGSTEVFARLIRRLRKEKFMLIGASRLEDADEDLHTLELPKELQDLIESSHVKKIALKHLSTEGIQKLVTVFLGGRELPKGEFFQRLVHLSQGRPLALLEYLRTMVDSGCLYPIWGSWAADLSAIEKLKLSSNVIDLILKRIESLSADTQEVLSLAAVVSSPFKKDILEKVVGRNVDADLQRASRSHLLESEHGQVYTFVHDRVQEALLSRIPPDKLKDFHQRTAEILQSLPEGPVHEANLGLEIANHLNQGHPQADPMKAYQVNLAAGLWALKNYSNSEGYEFFVKAGATLETLKGRVDPIPLYEAWAETSLRTNRNAEGFELLSKILAISKDPFVRARVYAKRAEARLATTDFPEAIKNVVQGLKELGESYYTPRWKIPYSLIKHGLVGWFLNKTGLLFASAKSGVEDEGKRATYSKHLLIARLLSSGVLPAAIKNDLVTLLDLSLRQVFHAHFLGPSRELANAYGSLCILAGGARLKKTRLRYRGRALNFAQQMGDPTQMVKAKGDSVVASLISGQYLESETEALTCLRNDRAWISNLNHVPLYGTLGFQAGLRGLAEDAVRHLNPMLAPFQGETSLSILPGGIHARMASLAVLGKVHEALGDLQWMEAIQYAKRVKSDRISLIFYLANSILYLSELGEGAEKIEPFVEIFRSLKVNPKWVGLPGWSYFVNLAHARLRFCLDEMFEKKSVTRAPLEAFKEAVADLDKVRSPLTDQHRLAFEGALSWMTGDLTGALKLLNEADLRGQMEENPWARYQALHVRAALLQHMGNQAASHVDAREALRIAIKHSWLPRIRRLKTFFSKLEDPPSSMASAKFHASSPSKLGASLGTQDTYQNYKYKRHLEALLRLNRATSQLGSQDEQLRGTLDEVIKILNAERAFLFLTENRRTTIHMARDAKHLDIAPTSGFSSTVVTKVEQTKQAMIFSGNGEGEIPTSESVVVHQLRSIMATPLIGGESDQEEFLGVLYVDSTVARGLFQEEDLDILRAISGHLAVSIQAAKARQLELDRNLLQKEQELAEIRLASAHAAGMAEIATGSIHNIGNTLTLVVATFDLLREGLLTSKILTIVKGTQILKENRDRMEAFMAQKGAPLLSLFVKLSDILLAERKAVVERIETIERGIANVKEVILVQQEYAKAGLNRESVEMSTLLDEVLFIQSASLERHKITVIKNYQSVAPVTIQKSKLVNVILNVLSNAKEAIGDQAANAVITVDLFEEDQLVKVRVSDTGQGISPENMAKLFNQNFTTKKGGHGFGLHICQAAMAEVGGKIEAQSEGPGKGAAFTMSIPKGSV